MKKKIIQKLYITCTYDKAIKLDITLVLIRSLSSILSSQEWLSKYSRAEGIGGCNLMKNNWKTSSSWQILNKEMISIMND